jgi:hypothetical protein
MLLLLLLAHFFTPLNDSNAFSMVVHSCSTSRNRLLTAPLLVPSA